MCSTGAVEVVHVVMFLLDNYSQCCWKWHFCRWLCAFFSDVLTLTPSVSELDSNRVKQDFLSKMSPCGRALIMCSRVTAVIPAPDPKFPSLHVGFVQRLDGQLRGTAGHCLGGPNLHHGMAAHCSQPCTRRESPDSPASIVDVGQGQSPQDAPTKNN